MIEQDFAIEYQLPVHTHRELSDFELQLLHTMDEYRPSTEYRVGDLAVLHKVPAYLRHKTPSGETIPVYWQVRMVLSLWAYDSWALGNILRLDGSWDDAIYAHGGDVRAMMRKLSRIPSYKASKPVIYAHGFPHAQWPNTAAWFYEGHLRRDFLRSHSEDWQLILHEAETEYVGIAPEAAINGISLDLAPDLYGMGHRLHRPFTFEEQTFHSLSCLGSEEAAIRGIDPRIWAPERTESGRIIL